MQSVHHALFPCENDSDLLELLFWLSRHATRLSLLKDVFFVYKDGARYVQLFASRPFEHDEAMSFRSDFGMRLHLATETNLDQRLCIALRQLVTMAKNDSTEETEDEEPDTEDDCTTLSVASSPCDTTDEELLADSGGD